MLATFRGKLLLFSFKSLVNFCFHFNELSLGFLPLFLINKPFSVKLSLLVKVLHTVIIRLLLISALSDHFLFLMHPLIRLLDFMQKLLLFN